MNIKVLLLSLQKILMNDEEDISENSSTMAEELIDVAAVISRLSASSNIDHKISFQESSQRNGMSKTVEENEDLKRQIIFLQQQLQEKDHRAKVLEKLVTGKKTLLNSSTEWRQNVLVNSATQTDRSPTSISIEANRVPKSYLNWNNQPMYESRPTTKTNSPNSSYQFQPCRSRSSHSLVDGMQRPRRLESPYSVINSQVNGTILEKIDNPKKYKTSLSSSFSISSVSSSSSSNLNSPTSVQEANSVNIYRENTNKPHSKHTYSMKPASKPFASNMVHINSESATSSHLSQRQFRSRSSHSPSKRRADSPGGKSYNSSSSTSTRHGWLYTQQYNCTADVARGRVGRHTGYKAVRPCKPTIL